jgi:threonylcarbamoyladenosine tRNA methylthiotransferase MtaB
MAEALTFGCRLNAAESEAMRALAGGMEALIVNTCAVTAEAEAQARQAIRRAARETPGRPILVTGCAAEIAPAAWAALPGVARVIPNARKLDPAIWGAAAAPAPPARARALLPVQTGCDHDCTFCVIPRGRGAARSVPLPELVRGARALAAQGVAEIVLTGVDIASWGTDLPGRPALGTLVRAVLDQVPELPRLRLSSLDPAGMDEALWRGLAEEPRLMPHLHLSLQHGAALILKRMKRRHTRAQALALCRRAATLRPGIALGADLIAGFPTETEAHVAEMLDFVAEAGLSFLHVFPYSERPGTPAARMPQLPVPVRRERAARLREAGRLAARRFYEGRVGGVERVVLERPDRGHAESFAPVRLTTPGPPGALRAVRVTGCDDDGLIASLPPAQPGEVWGGGAAMPHNLDGQPAGWL